MTLDLSHAHHIGYSVNNSKRLVLITSKREKWDRGKLAV